MQRLDYEFCEELRTLALRFSERGFRLYAVGGLVRSVLLDFDVVDIDITSRMRPDKLIALCDECGYRFVPKGVDFGMVEVHIGGYTFEHTTFRSDSYAEGGFHRPSSIAFSDSLEEDAFRRDFTCNALYCDILSGEIVDPTGGIEDISNKLIRATSLDPYTILNDDGLRILRLVRFAAQLGFDIEEKTFAAARECVHLLNDISFERIRDELNKILMADTRNGLHPDDSVLRGLNMMEELGITDVILPELIDCRGVAQRKEFHKYDVINHIFHTVACAKPILSLRLACFFHDIAKPIMVKKNGNMHEHEKYGGIISREIMERLRYSNDEIELVSWLVVHHMFDLNGNAKEKTLKCHFSKWGMDKTRLLILIREADWHGSGYETGAVKSAERWKTALREMIDNKTPFSASELDCSGKDIMEWLDIPPSPLVGEIKSALLRHCAVRPKDNIREKLRELAMRYRK